jgi:poly-gamma-glutamate synthesis protein (capsule biosynthesis protein)
MLKKSRKNGYKNLDKVLIVIFALICFLVIGLLFFPKFPEIKIPNINKVAENNEIALKILFTGDVFLDRHIDELSRKSELKYAYPFQGLDTFDRASYDAWIGNLECPVTEEQSTPFQKENWLRFSCKKEYLPELAKYFTAVSIANNHTDNMNGRKGIEETRNHLTDAGIEYFGDYDNSQTDEMCKIVIIKKLPIALCGFHGVYKLPTDNDLEVIKKYSKHFITIVMPHQGVEYEPRSNTYQKLIYRKMIDNGADAVIGSHPHVIEETEVYKGKYIFYSLGNFIFDQSWSKTRDHMEVEVNIETNKSVYNNLGCNWAKSLKCLQQAEEQNIQKPEYKISYTPIFSHAGMDFVTKKLDLDDKTYKAKLKSINFKSI